MFRSAEGRNRTGMGRKPRQILSLLRLPVSPPRHAGAHKSTTGQAELGNRGGPINIATTRPVVNLSFPGRILRRNIKGKAIKCKCFRPAFRAGRPPKTVRD